MATFNEINNSFTQRIASMWSTTAVAWDNVDFEPNPDQAWIRCTLISTPSENNELGLSVIHRGLFWIQIFTPLNKGTGEAYTIVDELTTLFSNVQFDGIFCHAADVQRVGDDGRGWFQVNFRVPYWSHQRG